MVFQMKKENGFVNAFIYIAGLYENTRMILYSMGNYGK